MSGNRDTNAASRRHRGVAVLLACMAIGMLGMAYAAVPLYRLFCQVTGYGGTTQRAEIGSSRTAEQMVTIRFDANTSAGMPWDFRPAQATIQVRMGETALAFFHAHNPTSARVNGTATFNVTPEIAGRFFNKLECFCFTEQSLGPGESVEMPVSFFVDPEMLKEPGAENVREITLSYTFFRTETDTAGLPAKTAKSGGG